MSDLPIYRAASPVEVRAPEDSFPCMTLRCVLPAADCVARQEKSDSETEDRTRGQGARYPLCRSRLCADGRWIRSKLGPWLTRESGAAVWRDQRMRPGEEKARQRLEAAGLLSAVPSIDAGDAR